MKKINYISNIILVTAICFSPLVSVAQVSVVEKIPGLITGDEASSVYQITPDGRYVLFASSATNLVVGDLNSAADIFVYDRNTDDIELISVDSSEVQADEFSRNASISDDGRYVAFESPATNLVSGDTNATRDIFLRDRTPGTTIRASVSHLGAELVDQSNNPVISGNGQYILFESQDVNVVSGVDANGDTDIYMYDIDLETVELISSDSLGNRGDLGSSRPATTSDGRYVVFSSEASNLIADDTNNMPDIFLKDLQDGSMERVSLGDGGIESNGECLDPSISSNARYVTFQCDSTNLVAGVSGIRAIYLYDRQTEEVILVSSATDETIPNSDSSQAIVSGDGRMVIFFSSASNLVSGDNNGFTDLFLKDTFTGLTERLNNNVAGVEGDAQVTGGLADLTQDGRYVVYSSDATNLIDDDTNGFTDVFFSKISDNDGIVDTEEEAGPNAGDADDDGYSDSMEHDTSTFENSLTGEYVTITSEGECFDNEDVSLISESGLSTTDNSYSYPYGIVDFGIRCKTSLGGSAEVTMHFLGNLSIDGITLRKVNDTTGVSQEVSGAVISSVTFNGEPAIRVVYTITDGGVLDEDGVVNGVIIDPVGLAESDDSAPVESGGSSSGSRPKVAMTESNNATTCVLLTTTMKQGSKYGEVSKLQTELTRLGFTPGIADGLFGPKTNLAVKAFQTAKKLASDGIVGPMTRGVLNDCK